MQAVFTLGQTNFNITTNSDLKLNKRVIFFGNLKKYKILKF